MIEDLIKQGAASVIDQLLKSVRTPEVLATNSAQSAHPFRYPDPLL